MNEVSSSGTIFSDAMFGSCRYFQDIIAVN
jgi:hypothetical protein